MINWQLFPKSIEIPLYLKEVIKVFETNCFHIDSNANTHDSNYVLEKVRADLEAIGYQVEKSKTTDGKIKVPVLFGRNGLLEKSFDADAYNKERQTVLEVEAGRGVTNYQFLKDLFQACMMSEVENLIIVVRNIYAKHKDFEIVLSFFNTLYASNRIILPLKRILIIGY